MSDLRLGFWAPHQGPLIARGDSQETATASIADNLALIRQGDALGFDAVLIPQQLMNIRDIAEPVLEPWSLAVAAAAQTHQIELIVAVKPLLYHVGIAAKHALALAEISGGRAGLNLISGWFLPELHALGIDTIAHDDRYGLSREWLAALRPLLRGEEVHLDGTYLKVDGLRLVPDERTLGKVHIYTSGESNDGRAFGAAQSDVHFLHPRPLVEIAPTLADLRRRAESHERSLRFGLSTRIFARKTEAEAYAAFERLSELGAQAASARSRAGMERAGQSGAARTTPEAAANGTVIVGSYEQVAEALRARAALGIDLVMAQLQPVAEELDRIATHVFPLLDRPS